MRYSMIVTFVVLLGILVSMFAACPPKKPFPTDAEIAANELEMTAYILADQVVHYQRLYLKALKLLEESPNFNYQRPDQKPLEI